MSVEQPFYSRECLPDESLRTQAAFSRRLQKYLETEEGNEYAKRILKHKTSGGRAYEVALLLQSLPQENTKPLATIESIRNYLKENEEKKKLKVAGVYRHIGGGYNYEFYVAPVVEVLNEEGIDQYAKILGSSLDPAGENPKTGMRYLNTLGSGKEFEDLHRIIYVSLMSNLVEINVYTEQERAEAVVSWMDGQVSDRRITKLFNKVFTHKLKERRTRLMWWPMQKIEWEKTSGTSGN